MKHIKSLSPSLVVDRIDLYHIVVRVLEGGSIVPINELRVLLRGKERAESPHFHPGVHLINHFTTIHKEGDVLGYDLLFPGWGETRDPARFRARDPDLRRSVRVPGMHA